MVFKNKQIVKYLITNSNLIEHLCSSFYNEDNL